MATKTHIETDAAPIRARHEDGVIYVELEGSTRLAFPVTYTPRLAAASPADLAEIELLPYTLHWPRLDEDIGIEGLIRDGYAL